MNLMAAEVRRNALAETNLARVIARSLVGERCMSIPSVDDQFVRNLTANQHRLYGLILGLLPNAEAARDVLQETNVVLWRKAHEFDPATDFGAWSATIAYYQVMAFRTTRGRDRHVFDDELLETLADEASEMSQGSDRRLAALEACLDRLAASDRRLLLDRYAKGGNVKDLAARAKRPPGTLRVTLFRLRQALLRCVEGRLQVKSSITPNS